MARKPEIQYVNEFYVHGSEARVVAFKPKKRTVKTVLPKIAPDKTIRIMVDPLAVCAMAVVVAMLVMMIVGGVQYVQARQAFQTASNQVIAMQNENVRLRQQYKAGYNLEEVAKAAEALGMIPKADAEVVYYSCSPVIPVREPEPTMWENILWFLEGLFA